MFGLMLKRLIKTFGRYFLNPRKKIKVLILYVMVSNSKAL